MRAPAPACSLARALRALAGGLSKERLGRLTLLGNASEILPKTLPETSQSSLWPSWGSFSLPGGHFGPPKFHFGSPGAHFHPPGALLGAPGALLGHSWEPLGSFLALQKPYQIAPGGSPGGPPHRSLIFEPFWRLIWLHF